MIILTGFKKPQNVLQVQNIEVRSIKNRVCFSAEGQNNRNLSLTYCFNIRQADDVYQTIFFPLLFN